MKPEEIKKIIQEKVIGKIEPRHTEKGHFYYFVDSGHVVTSVTGKIGILSKPHLTPWAVKMAALWLLEDHTRLQRLAHPDWQQAMINGMQLAHTDNRDFAGDVGHKTHSILERALNDWLFSGEKPKNFLSFAPENCEPRAIAAARAGEKFFNDNPRIIPIASELLVGDRKFSAGTLDFLGLLDNKLILLDWKSSNSVSQEYILQTVAYAKFFEHMTGLKIWKIKIVHLDKDSDKYTVYNVRNINKAWKAFKQVCGVYDWRNDESSVLEKDIKKLKI